MTFTSKLGGILTVALAFSAVFCAGAQAIYVGPKTGSSEQPKCVYTISEAEFTSALDCLRNEASEGIPGPGWKREGAQEGALSPSTMIVGKIAPGEKIAFASAAASVSCSKAKVVGEITSEALGRSTNKLGLEECSVESGEFAECEVSSPGEPAGSVLAEVDGELVFLGSEAEAEKETGKLGERFTPTTENTLFTLEFGGAHCGHTDKVPVEGSLIAEFAHANIESVVQEIVQPREPIARAFQWLGERTVREVTSELAAFGEPASIVGKEDLKLESGIKWGVFT